MEFSKIAENINNRILDGEPLSVDLQLEDDSTVTCETMLVMTVADKDYIVLLPLNEEGENDDGEVWFYGYVHHDDAEPELTYIDDDDEYERVSDAFDEYLDEVEFDELLEEEPETD